MSEQPLEQAIGAILQDPAQLQSLLAFAGSLGISPPEAPPAKAAPPPQPQTQAPAVSSSNEALGELLQKAGKLDKRQENLLNALKPFLKPERREKIDRAMQAARLSRLAGAALRGHEQKP